MLWPGIKKLGRELSLLRTDTEVAGKLKNCFVKLYDGTHIKVLELYAPEIDDSDKEYILEKLKLNKVKKYEWYAHGVKVVFVEYVMPYSINKIRGILLDFVDYFSVKYPGKGLHCQRCDNVTDLEAYNIDNIAVLNLCDDCFKTIEKENADLIYEVTPTNYFAGFIGALLFSVPGILVTIDLFVFLEKLAAISSVIYVFLGILGYKKFKGKISQTGVVLIFLSTLIMIGVGIIASFSVVLFKELKAMNVEMNIEMLILFFQLPEIQQELMKNIFISYGISALYLFSQFFQLMKQWKRDKSIKIVNERSI